jgi:5-formaminoimidazole-4-carboxamide-1-beta-D-ribofuranosyl 5'-monophosphate synthetase
MKMKGYIIAIVFLILTSCNGQQSKNTDIIITQKDLKNEKMKDYVFLKDMYADSYFPKFLVDKVKTILVGLCSDIEKTSPKNLDELYKLTHTSTIKINELQDEFFEHDSEIETGARESIGHDFDIIAKSYGFNTDIEELIAPREW